MNRKNFEWDEQNGQWEGCGNLDDYDCIELWNTCSHCDHCYLENDNTMVCELDDHIVSVDTICDYNMKSELL